MSSISRKARVLLVLLSWVGLMASPAEAAAQASAPLVVTSFGTSLTAKGGWQGPLATAMEACHDGPVEVRTIARSGAASDWGLNAVGDVAKGRPDVALIEFAVNDAALNRWISLADSRRNMRRIVEGIRASREDTTIYFMTMNPLHGRRAWLRPWRDDYERVHHELAEELGVGVIDHSGSWERLGPEAIRRAIPDGAHPDPAVAAAIIVPNVVARLRQDGLLHCANEDRKP